MLLHEHTFFPFNFKREVVIDASKYNITRDRGYGLYFFVKKKKQFTFLRVQQFFRWLHPESHRMLLRLRRFYKNVSR